VGGDRPVDHVLGGPREVIIVGEVGHLTLDSWPRRSVARDRGTAVAPFPPSSGLFPFASSSGGEGFGSRGGEPPMIKRESIDKDLAHEDAGFDMINVGPETTGLPFLALDPVEHVRQLAYPKSCEPIHPSWLKVCP